MLDELEASLGPAGVLRPGDDLSRYLDPARGPRGDATAVVRPGSTDQVRIVVAWARRHRVRLIPQGANSGLVGASTPPPGGDQVVLSLERMHRDPSIDAADRSAVVDAGVRLSELNDAARPHGLHLPIDLGADPSLGGMVATNTGGARMVAHGDMRRHVLGLRAVIADDDCSVIDELTTLRKRNVGPSIGHLLIGAGGALGIVTEVAVELTPIPPDRSCAWIVPRDGSAAVDALNRLERDDRVTLTAFEVLSANALDAALATHSSPRSPFAASMTPALSALVEVCGHASEDGLVASLSALSEASLIDDAVVVPPEDAWALRHAVTDGLAARGVVVGLDVSVRRDRLPDAVGSIRAQLAASVPRAELADFGHWADGGVHANVVFPHEGDPPSTSEQDGVRALVLETIVDRFGGSFSAEHGVGPTNAQWWIRTTPTGTRTALRSLRAALDPLGILGHPGLPYSD